jgi:hypothetical protein
MSLLLEALKALADRTVPADGTTERVPTELPAASVPAANPAQGGGADFRDATAEQLLEGAASAIAESLQDEQPGESETLRVEKSVAELKAPAGDEPVASWAEIWQQALMPPEATRSSPDESTANVDESADDTLPGDSPVMGEKHESIFAPWFAAHGLANEPSDSSAPPTESLKEEIAESHESEFSESLAVKATLEIPTSPESDSIPAPYAPEAAHEHPVDPTWELYDRSLESLTAWGSQHAVCAENKHPAEPPIAALSIQAHTPAEYIPDHPQQLVKAQESPVKTLVIPPQAVSKSAQPEQETPRKEVRRSASAPQTVSMPLAASKGLASELPSAQTIEEIRVSEPYLRLANRLLQSLRTARPQAIILASVDEASARTLDIAQLAKAITLSEEGKLLFIQAQAGKPDLTRRLGINPDQHPRWQGPGSELYERIYCSSQGRIDFLPQENVCSSAIQSVDPLLIARCKRQYSLVLVDVGVVSSEIARSLAPQGDAALLVAVMQHTPREIAVQSNALLRRLGVRTAGCVLMEPRPADSATRKFSL